MQKIILLIMVVFITGCGSKIATPTVSMMSFNEQNYPCFKVSFPNQIIYDGFTKNDEKNSLLIKYKILIPNYDATVTKYYTVGDTIRYEELQNSFDEAAQLYSIGKDDEYVDKEGLLVLDYVDGDLVLKAIVVLYLQDNVAARVEVSRSVKKLGTFTSNTVQSWKDSTSGRKNIENMTTILDYIYDSVKSQECTLDNSANINLMK